MSSTPAPTFSRRKSIAFTAIILLGLLLTAELLARIVAFVAYGFSPYFLTYGFIESYVEGEEGHSENHGGYFKFPPSRMLKQYGMFAEPTPIRINNLGFRGADFEPQKAPGAVRIACLGASSTFGFYDRDGHTYPELLEARLRELVPGVRIEVLNAGIPHAKTGNMLAMLRNELAEYQPDIVTFYEGFNDAGAPKDETRLQAVARWLHGHFALYVGLKRALEAVGGPRLHSRWTPYAARSTPESIQRQIDMHLPEFDENLRAIVSAIRSAGAEPVLIRQPMTTRFSDGLAHGKPPTGVGYGGEVAWVRDNLTRHGYVGAMEAHLLIHAALLADVDAVAADTGATLVDNVSLVDANPEYFASYVHLTEEANAALAARLADALAPAVRSAAAN